MESKNNLFGPADVSMHNNNKDCWVIINARVYDVTNFLNDHPGGDDVLLAMAGKDASEEFEDAGHGSAARLMLDEFYVGEMDQVTSYSGISSTTTFKPKIQLKQQIVMKIEEQQSGLNFIVNSVWFLIPLAVLGVSIGFGIYK